MPAAAPRPDLSRYRKTARPNKANNPSVDIMPPLPLRPFECHLDNLPFLDFPRKKEDLVSSLDGGRLVRSGATRVGFFNEDARALMNGPSRHVPDGPLHPSVLETAEYRGQSILRFCRHVYALPVYDRGVVVDAQLVAIYLHDRAREGEHVFGEEVEAVPGALAEPFLLISDWRYVRFRTRLLNQRLGPSNTPQPARQGCLHELAKLATSSCPGLGVTPARTRHWMYPIEAAYTSLRKQFRVRSFHRCLLDSIYPLPLRLIPPHRLVTSLLQGVVEREVRSKGRAHAFSTPKPQSSSTVRPPVVGYGKATIRDAYLRHALSPTAESRASNGPPSERDMAATNPRKPTWPVPCHCDSIG